MKFEGIIHRGFYYNLLNSELTMKATGSFTVIDRYGEFEDFFPFVFDLKGFHSLAYSILFQTFKIDYGGFTRSSNLGEPFEAYLEWVQNERQ